MKRATSPAERGVAMARSRASGFSLIELIMAFAIVGILLSLLMPALQFARESARRAQCQTNLKQFGIAMHAYHGSHQSLPPGHIQYGWPPTTLPPHQRTPWLPHILAELGAQALFNSYNFQLGLVGEGKAGLDANSTVHMSRLALLLCPSDSASQQGFTAWGPPREKGNYAVNWGNTTWWQIDLPGNPFLRAPFGTNSSVRLADFADGTNATLLMAELIITKNGDFRGEPWNDDGGASQFYTTIPPNSALPDQLGSPWCQPIGNPPCVNVPEPRDLAFTAARSRHSAGVGTLMADGSARFVPNSVNGDLWRALGSLDKGETMGSF